MVGLLKSCSCLVIFMTAFNSMRCNTETSCDYNFLGPSNDVFIMDRSKSISPHQFDMMADFLRDFIHKFFMLRNDQNRIAVVLYNADVTVPIDFITVPDTVPECELFLSGGLWERSVQFDSSTRASPGGQLFYDAFEKAVDIISSRHMHNQSESTRIWAFSDLEQDTNMPSIINPRLPSNTQTYAFGIGHNMYRPHMVQFAGNNNNCRALNASQWMQVVEDVAAMPNKLASKQQAEQVLLHDPALCDACDQCTCMEYSHGSAPTCIAPTDDPNSADKSNSSDIMDEVDIAWLITGALGLFIILSVLIVLCACVTRSRRQRREEKKMQKFTEPINGMPSPSTFTVSMPTTPTPANHPDVVPIYQPQPVDSADIYVNGTFAADLIAHGVDVRTTERNKNKHTTGSATQTAASAQAPDVTAAVHSTAQKRGVPEVKVQKRGSPEVPKGRFYIKNPSAAETSSTAQTRLSKKQLHVPGHNRGVSDVSASSIPSYIAPIPDDPDYANGLRPESTGDNDYSYPYMDIQVELIRPQTGTDDVSLCSPSDVTSHKYEQCTFPIRKADNKTAKPVTKTSSDVGNAGDELLETISKQRACLKPTSKQLSFKTKTAKNDDAPSTSAVLKPLTIDVQNDAQKTGNTDAKNEDTSTKKTKKAKAKAKESSMKLGTSKFNAIKAKLERNNRANDDNRLNIKQLNIL